MQRFILTATLAWLLAGCAQPGMQAPAGAIDPQAPVPATRYEPAIGAQAAPASGTTPDRTWRAANATVGARNPMDLTMPGMGGDHQHDAAPAEAGKTIPLHGHHAGMDMQGMQCMAGDRDGKMDMKGMQCMADGQCGCCAGTGKADDHAGHAGDGRMALRDGCCCGHDAAAGQPAACKPGGACGCCHHKEAP